MQFPIHHEYEEFADHRELKCLFCQEAALMELLNFMHSNALTTHTAPTSLDVLMAADKFEVASCMRYYSRLLRLIWIRLLKVLLLKHSVLVIQLIHLDRFQEEVMKLPLAGIEAILSSDNLQVASEDAVYDFVLKWKRAHYPLIDECREILSSRLGHCIHFSFMSCRKLQKVLTCNDFEHEFASKLVVEALFYKVKVPHRQQTQATEESASMSHHFDESSFCGSCLQVSIC
ncbi:BTB/POZ domain-containing protein POB1 [Capsicum annuum]|uniref:BTB/POZ domain-containing protein POB1 n=1 Tax=Capsicum annuum TaxID=4072 RepID=A0A2G2ZYJ7_CAPAN|nr:BTB/POZ domain-containing protein POB1 [Capsicum annuum]PHT87044.1 BTB/POZ domain-containing protein POB1 [Capsicum annuum]